MSAAMLPPAPGLFSTTTDWPQTSCRRLLISRAVMSVEPPGVNGTTTRTGFAGQSAPAARRESAGAASAAALAPRKRRRFSIGILRIWPPDCLRSLFFKECEDGRRQNQCAILNRCDGLSLPLPRGERWPHDMRSIRVFVVVPGGGNLGGIRQPPVQIDIPAALGAKRLRGLGGGFAADRARLCGPSWHSTSRTGSENLHRRAASSSRTAAGRRYCCRSRPS